VAPVGAEEGGRVSGRGREAWERLTEAAHVTCRAVEIRARGEGERRERGRARHVTCRAVEKAAWPSTSSTS